MRMVDVGSKAATSRVAVASGHVAMNVEARSALISKTVKKGDVFAAARIAAIMAAKKTPELVPLCHPIGLSGIECELSMAAGGVDIEVTVKTVERTGVEMEALAGVMAATLTVYDMLKSIDQQMVIGPVQLERKRGGRSGDFRRTTVAKARRA